VSSSAVRDVRTVVVTGASTGIGAATCGVLVAAGLRVFGSVRKQSDGERLRDALGASFEPLYFDVTDAGSITAAARIVERSLGEQRLFGLVNNAGLAVLGPLLHLSLDDLRRQLDVNIIGQLAVTQAFAPALGTDPARLGAPGRIVMMSSVGGRNASPFLGAYNASKFGLEGISESLRRELMLFGIHVVIVAPGPIATPIWDKADALDLAAFADSPYLQALTRAKRVIEAGRLGLPPERVGRVVLNALTTRQPKVRYTVTPTRLHQWLVDWLPRRVIDRAIAKRLRLKPR
jgi:NAD(P)-dependent dehydrogenase (short-subunit alcohol dehydrogenase family)